jgi:hypothetical protein
MMVNISSVQHGHLAMATWPKDSGLNAVELTVTDAAGDGFKTWFGFDQALDTAMKLIGAIARLRGWSKP